MKSTTNPPAAPLQRIVEEDFSGSFGRLRKDIRHDNGTTLDEFLKTLAPRYAIVYRDIGLGYLLVAATVVLAAIAESVGVPKVAVALAAGFSIGYWIAYIQLFIHEGAHWNLAEDRTKSDRLANTLIGWWAAQEIGAYREIHFHHHRALGKSDDSERTYFSPLNPAFIVKGVSGILVLAVLLTRRSVASAKTGNQAKKIAPPIPTRALVALVGVLVHASIMGLFAYSGFWATAAGWALGLGAFFPLFGALRQLLEHRSNFAVAGIDYAFVDHGAYTRIFGNGWIDRTFGGAGFNRHLLHHWLPMVSYTRLPDLEEFLLGTSLKPIIESRRTTYFETFWKLFHVR